jgi:hypothetical protein
MSFKSKTIPLLLAGAVYIGAASSALADPPGRVGRVSYIDGTVSTRQDDQQSWAFAGVNQPVTTGDDFWTQPGARSEVEVGEVQIHMDSTTELDVTRLDDEATQLNVAQGSIDVRLGRDIPGGVQITTGTGQINLTTAGRYRIDAGHPDAVSGQPQGTIQLSVLKGQATINEPGAQTTLQAGESAIVNTAQPGLNLVQAQTTPFDNWAISHDHAEYAAMRAATAAAPSVVYVSPEMTGAEDLQQYGQWNSDPTYGQVWYPQNVPTDWAPYRYGHWANVQPWGWTWIDDAPWGFAPFHYGRWVNEDNRWGWVPAPPEQRPVYAPALVAFVGGRHWGASFSEGQPVGWVPLAPSEPFHPYYQASAQYELAINLHNDRHAQPTPQGEAQQPSHFANSAAATAIPAAAFMHGAQVHQSALHEPHGGGVAPQAATPVAAPPAPHEGGANFAHAADAGHSGSPAPQPAGTGWHYALQPNHDMPHNGEHAPMPSSAPVSAVSRETMEKPSMPSPSHAPSPFHAPGHEAHGPTPVDHYQDRGNQGEPGAVSPQSLAPTSPHAQSIVPDAEPHAVTAPGSENHGSENYGHEHGAPGVTHAPDDHHGGGMPAEHHEKPVNGPPAPAVHPGQQPHNGDNHGGDHHDQGKPAPKPPELEKPAQPGQPPQQDNQPHPDDHNRP